MSINAKILIRSRNFGFQIRKNSSLVRTVTVRPSLRPYGELQVISPGVFKIPKKPFDMKVECLDSSPNEKKKQTVVAIHGTPANCYYFEAFAKEFHRSDSDVRFISLSLPDFRHTIENGYFWHTTPERVNFIRQFLSDMKIDTVDSFVCHSYGVQSVVALWDNPENLYIKSICMFAPHPFFKTKLFQNKHIFKKYYTFNNSLWYRLLEMYKVEQRHPILPLKFQNTNEFLVFCSLIYDEMVHGFMDRLQRSVNNTNIPISITFGAKEKTFSRENIIKFNAILGVGKNEIVTIDPKIHTEKDMLYNDKRVNSYLIEEGGHVVHLTHHSFALKSLTNLLKKIE